MEGRGEVHRDRPTDIRPLAGSTGALRHFHDQLDREYVDSSGIRSGNGESHGHVHQVPAAQAAEHELRRPDRDLQVPEVPVPAGHAGEGRRSYPAADRELRVDPRRFTSCWPSSTTTSRVGRTSTLQVMRSRVQPGSFPLLFVTLVLLYVLNGVAV